MFESDRELLSELDGRVGFVEAFVVEHAARLTAIKHMPAVRQERPRPALSAAACRVARPGDVLVMGSPVGRLMGSTCEWVKRRLSW